MNLSRKVLDDYYHGQDTPKDFSHLLVWLQDAAARHIHGQALNDVQDGDLVLSRQDARIAALRQGEVNCECREISTTMAALLNAVGIDARLNEWVGVTTFIDGWRHNTLEVYFDKHWMLMDVDTGVYFVHANQPLSGFEVKIGLDHGTLAPRSIRRLVPEKRFEPGNPKYASLIPVLTNDFGLLAYFAMKSDGLLLRPLLYAGVREDRLQRIVDGVKPGVPDTIQAVDRGAFLAQHYS